MFLHTSELFLGLRLLLADKVFLLIKSIYHFWLHLVSWKVNESHPMYTLETITHSNLSSHCHKVKLISRVQLFAIPWTVAYEAPPSMAFSRQGYWSGLPFPSPGDLPNTGIEPSSPALQADSLPSEPLGKPVIVSRKISLGSPATVLYGDAQNILVATLTQYCDRARLAIFFFTLFHPWFHKAILFP